MAHDLEPVALERLAYVVRFTKSLTLTGKRRETSLNVLRAFCHRIELEPHSTALSYSIIAEPIFGDRERNRNRGNPQTFGYAEPKE